MELAEADSRPHDRRDDLLGGPRTDHDPGYFRVDEKARLEEGETALFRDETLNLTIKENFA